MSISTRETGTVKRQDANGTVAAAGALTRPVVVEKRVYVPHWPQEEFIVPLLRREIESGIDRYGAQAREGRKALDVGCGGQPFRTLLEKIGYSYCGVDANATDAPDIVCAIDEALPAELLQRGPFDFVLCTEVLEHVADWGAAFANFERLLAPGGRVLITAPHFYQLHEEPFDFWRPTLHAVDYYAQRVGLQPIYRRAAGDAWDVLGTALANCQFMASSSRLLDRALAKFVRLASRATFHALRDQKLQHRVQAEGPLYISNIVILEKPSVG